MISPPALMLMPPLMFSFYMLLFLPFSLSFSLFTIFSFLSSLPLLMIRYATYFHIFRFRFRAASLRFDIA